jgi:hypothetical protein
MRQFKIPDQKRKAEIVGGKSEARQNPDFFANHSFRIEEYFQICLFFGLPSLRHIGGIPIPASDE